MSSNVDRHYPWTRWWQPSHAGPLSSDGFFVHPETEFLGASVEAYRLEALSDTPCLILLGEPGLGKTTAVREEVRRLKRGHEVLYLPLGAYGQRTLLHHKLFGSERWARWRESETMLHLFLDGLDEAFLQDGYVHHLVLNELEGWPGDLHRLRFRVVCRSAEWMSEFGSGLSRLWQDLPGSDGAAEYALAPLTAEDAGLAATAAGLERDSFLREVAERGLEDLAALPLTLAMLVQKLKSGESWPDSRAELLEDGADRLVTENSGPRRRASELEGRTPGQRLAVAKRLAACSLLSGRSTISLVTGDKSAGAIDPGSLAGFDEVDASISDHSRFSVDTGRVIDTLRSALFASAGPGSVTFRHRGIAEYLAGAYLASHDLSAKTLAQLLVAPGDADGNLIPQLREVAAWIAAVDTSAFLDLVAREPDVLLRVDRLELVDEDRARLVDALLALEPAERIERWDRRIWRNMASLRHHGLADQLSPLIKDKSAPWSVRRLAITLARVCEVEGCQSALLELAFSSDDPDYVRDDAVWALKEYGSPEVRKQLIPLAVEPIEDDRDDEIRGQALAATYPELLTTREMLAALHEPRRTHFYGAYRRFLFDVPALLPSDDLPLAVDWTRNVIDGDRRLVGGLSDLAEEILARVWSQLPDPRLASNLAAGLLPRLRNHERLLADRDDFQPDEWARRAVLPHLIEHIHADDIHPRWLAVTRPQLAHPDDVDWLLDQLQGAADESTRTRWAGLIEAAFSTDALSERLFDASRAVPELRPLMARWLDPVAVDSEEAGWWREQARTERDGQPTDISAEIDRDLERELARAESGDRDGWWQFVNQLLFNEYGQVRPPSELESDLTRYPGWQRLNEHQRGRVVRAAAAYLRSADPDTDRWWGSKRGHRPAWAGYKALCLLEKCDPTMFADLEEQTWASWMPIVFAYPRARGGAEDTHHDRVLTAASAAAPSSFSHWLIEKVKTEVADEENRLWTLRTLGRLPHSLDPAALEAAFNLAELPPRPARDYLDYLLARDPDRALAAAAAVLRDHQQSPARAAAVCAALFHYAGAVAWELVWEFLEARPEAGRDALEVVAHEERVDLAASLDDEQLALIVKWLFEHVPPSEDPPLEADVHWISPRESLRDARDGLLRSLVARGSDISVSTIEALHEAAPSDTLRYAVRSAKEARRANSVAPAPNQVLRVIKSRGTSHLILDEKHLLQATLEALERIQQKVQTGQPPWADQLWEFSGSARPKNEERLSDTLASWLQLELSRRNPVAREVEVRANKAGRGRPKSLDIEVWAPLPTNEVAKVAIEVKGCWNADLARAMETQLVSDYMKSMGARSGIYLVAWFDPAGWGEPGPTRGWDFPELAGAKEALERQAEALSREHVLDVAAVVLDGSRRL